MKQFKDSQKLVFVPQESSKYCKIGPQPYNDSFSGDIAESGASTFFIIHG